MSSPTATVPPVNVAQAPGAPAVAAGRPASTARPLTNGASTATTGTAPGGRTPAAPASAVQPGRGAHSADPSTHPTRTGEGTDYVPVALMRRADSALAAGPDEAATRSTSVQAGPGSVPAALAITAAITLALVSSAYARLVVMRRGS